MDIVAKLLSIIISGFLGYFFGVVKERNSIKWKENRNALQCAYAYFYVLRGYMRENTPLTNDLIQQLNDLKFKHLFNITDNEIFNKISNFLEVPFYDTFSKEYNPDIKESILNFLDEIIPRIKKALH